MGIADNIKCLLDIRGIKPADLSRDSGVPQARISEIVSEKTKNPRMATLQKIAKALGVTVSDLTDDPKTTTVSHADAPTARHTQRQIRDNFVIASLPLLTDDQSEMIFDQVRGMVGK
jgi:transcriptional regulator with XRE-family HTH domain